MIYILVVIIFALLIFGIDRHFKLSDLENDLKILLGDFLIARDASDGRIRVHYQATVVAVKKLIKEHFKEV